MQLVVACINNFNSLKVEFILEELNVYMRKVKGQNDPSKLDCANSLSPLLVYLAIAGPRPIVLKTSTLLKKSSCWSYLPTTDRG
jgi:hypothetical protein